MKENDYELEVKNAMIIDFGIIADEIKDKEEILYERSENES